MNAYLSYFVRRGVSLLLALAFGACLPTLAPAEHVLPELAEVPVERLVANFERKLDTVGSSSSNAPTAKEEAAIRLNLARLHGMAYALKTETATVIVGQEDYGMWISPGSSNVPFSAKPATNPELEAAAKRHLEKAIQGFARAVELDESNVIAALGHAWCVDQSGEKAEAIRLYRKVIDMAWKTDSTARVGDETPFITSETIGYLIPLLDAAKDAEEIATLNERKAKLKAIPRAVTPIAVPLRAGLTLDEIVNPAAQVRFDADGTRLGKSWSWIRPEAGWLVHDRQGSGQITSSLQLFGNVTFWLFWDNGYEAMSSLDDNLDGSLTGEELAGLAIWQDANGNGQSDPGEVRPLADWGIEALSCRHRDYGSDPNCKVYSPEGVRFTDGTTRATYDVLLLEHP